MKRIAETKIMQYADTGWLSRNQKFPHPCDAECAAVRAYLLRQYAGGFLD